MRVLSGKGISPGYARGRAVVLRSGAGVSPGCRQVAQDEVQREIGRFLAALEKATVELGGVRRRLAERVGQAEAAILDAQDAILHDVALQRGIREHIVSNRVNAEWAVQQEMEQVAVRLESTRDVYLAERAVDVRDLRRRLLGHFPGASKGELPRLPADSVLVADHLLPSDTIQLDRDRVCGILVEHCGRTSHAAILAKALGIPAVSDLPDICDRIRSGSELLVDGLSGEIAVDPDEQRRARFGRQAGDYASRLLSAGGGDQQACVSSDGVRIELHANLGRVAEAGDVRAQSLDGVGLFRTEVLFLGNAAPPTLDEHREAYRRVARELRGLPLVIRVLDLGGDKRPTFLPPLSQHNPTLGLRGLRFALKESDLLRTQLHAILDVAQEHPVRVLFPMVVGGGDLGAVIEVLREVAHQQGHSSLPPVGAMIETPAALFALDEILERADFLSIGSNDLTQFLLAADRDAVELIDDYSILHPSVLRALRGVVTKAEEARKPLSVCGEAAGDPVLAPVLVGLGVRRLSMSPARVPAVRLALRELAVDRATRLAEALLACHRLDEIRERVLEHFAGRD